MSGIIYYRVAGGKLYFIYEYFFKLYFLYICELRLVQCKIAVRELFVVVLPCWKHTRLSDQYYCHIFIGYFPKLNLKRTENIKMILRYD